MKKLLLCLLLTGCVTTTITKPDGSVVKTTSQDPAIVGAITGAVVNGVVQGGLDYIKRQGQGGEGK